MITRKRIEERLRLHILNVCMAAVAGNAGDLTEAQKYLFDTVETIVRETKPQCGMAGCPFTSHQPSATE